MNQEVHSLESQVARADAAVMLRENEIFVEITDGLKADLFTQWTETAVSQQPEREEIFRLFQVVESLEARVQEIIDSGKMASTQLQPDLIKKDT